MMWQTSKVYMMENFELKIQKSRCVTARLTLFEKRNVGSYYVNTSYLDILAQIALKIDVINTPGLLKKTTQKPNAKYL